MLAAKFELAVAYASGKVASDQTKDVANDTALQLRLYGLFKQATQGPCEETAPSKINFVKHLKWKAWKDLGDMPSKEAKDVYVRELTQAQPQWIEAVKRVHKTILRSKL